jgi:hypothetical protein
MTVHSMPAAALQDGGARTRSGRIKMLLVLLACAAPVLASYFMYFVVRPDARSNYGTLILPTRAMPALPMQTLDGKPLAASVLKGQWLLIAVGPAECPEGCQKRLFMQRQLREMLGRERDRIDKLWLISDDAAVSPALRAALDDEPALTVLRVPREALAAWLAPAAGAGLDEHLYLVDPMGEWMMRFPVPADPARIKRDLDRLLRAASSWDRAGR